MLKFKIASLDDVDEQFRGLYEEKDGAFVLKVDGVPESGKDDLTGLQNKSKELLDELKQEREKRRQLEAKDAEREVEDLKKAGDFEALQKISEEKHQNEIKGLQEQLDSMRNATKASTLNSAVAKLAGDIAGERSSLIAPHIRQRLSIIEKDGAMTVQVIDANGNPSPTMTLEQLGDEFRNNELFAPIVSGRQSSGGGANGSDGAGGDSDWDKYFDVNADTFSMDKCLELEKTNPSLYAQLIKKYS